ncbi:LptA/OstA family protein [Sphingomonas sp.]|uniref:LptA/OstA family protein n=1 Tax=Sphingomonas sp. TaxID=28214 RepID=UPI00286C6786|nr:LptA/OstA family protein [Sphingomonas sp.]
MQRPLLIITALATLFGVVGLANAEPVSALKGHDSNAPIDVSADRMEVQDRADRAVMAGNVHVKQQQLTLDTARLTIAYTNGPGGLKMQRLDAAGGVVVKSPTETARGAFGVYDLNRKLITLVGGVQLIRQQSQISGSRLVIDLTTGRAVVDGGAPGLGGSGGRVTGHFTVPQRKG